MRKEQIIREIASKFRLSEEKVREDFENLLKQYEGLAEKIAVKKTARRLARMYKNTEEYVGFIIGVSEARDRVAILKAKALKLFQENPEEAIASGVVNANGIPLDVRETIRGRPNPNYGMPFKEDEHEWVRDIYGIIRFNGVWKPFRISVWGSSAREIDLPLFTPVRFRAIYKGEVNEWIQLNISRFTSFQPIKEELDIYDIIKKTLGISPLSRVKRIAKGSRFYPIVTEGDVTRIRLEPLPTGNRLAWVDDDTLSWEEDEIMLLIPAHIQLTFGEGSRIMIVGLPRLLVRDTQERVSILVLGIYPLSVSNSSPDEEEVVKLEWEEVE